MELKLRPIALNDLPYPSQVRLESADGHWKVQTDSTGRAGFPDVPQGITLANLFIEKAGADNVAVPGFAWYGQQVAFPPDPINDWWAIPIPEKYARPLSQTWYQLPVLLTRLVAPTRPVVSVPVPEPTPVPTPIEPPHTPPVDSTPVEPLPVNPLPVDPPVVPPAASASDVLLDDFARTDPLPWRFVQYASHGEVEIVPAPGRPSQRALKIICTDKPSPAGNDIYADLQPFDAIQGDHFAWEKAVEVARYQPGRYRALELSILPDPRCNAPATVSNGYAELSVGTYTMARSRKASGFGQEAGGYHGYHSLLLPRTNGRWMTCKLMRMSGSRQGWAPPAAICRVTGGNGVPFQFMEPMVSDTGVLLKYTNEAPWVTPWTGATVVFGLWTAIDGIPVDGVGTLTGLTSGAVRTIDRALRYHSGDFENLNEVDACGVWAGFSDRWVQHGGANEEWYLDEPLGITYWDRVTRLYVSALGQVDASAPATAYVGALRYLADDRDDQVAVSNIGAFFDPETDRLYVTWQRNSSLHGKSFEVHVGYRDLHDAGLSDQPWQTVTDVGNAYAIMSAYGQLPGTNQRPLFIAVRPHDRASFAQMQIATV